MSKPLPPIFPEPQIERFSIKRAFNLILATLNLERGIFFTIWELIKSPGAAMQTYLFVDRKRYYDPLKFLLLSMAIYLFIIINFVPDTGFAEGFQEGLGGDNADAESMEMAKNVIGFFQRFSNLIILLSVPIAAFSSYLVFRRFILWYAEHLVLNAYLYSILSVASIILTLIFLKSPTTVTYLVFAISWLYSIYFFRDFFQISWGRSIWNSTVVYVFAMVLFFIFLTLGMFILMAIQM